MEHVYRVDGVAIGRQNHTCLFAQYYVTEQAFGTLERRGLEKQAMIFAFHDSSTPEEDELEASKKFETVPYIDYSCAMFYTKTHFVVFKRLQDLVIFVICKESEDESVMEEFLISYCQALTEQYSSKGVLCAELLLSEYEMILLLLNRFLFKGILLKPPKEDTEDFFDLEQLEELFQHRPGRIGQKYGLRRVS